MHDLKNASVVFLPKIVENRRWTLDDWNLGIRSLDLRLWNGGHSKFEAMPILNLLKSMP